jgi:hypothetical protein
MSARPTDPQDLLMWYRVRAAMLRADAAKPWNLRARSVMLYSACRCDWLGDRVEAAERGEFAETAFPSPTLH